jgi:hypothetical protein
MKEALTFILNIGLKLHTNARRFFAVWTERKVIVVLEQKWKSFLLISQFNYRLKLISIVHTIVCNEEVMLFHLFATCLHLFLSMIAFASGASSNLSPDSYRVHGFKKEYNFSDGE